VSWRERRRTGRRAGLLIAFGRQVVGGFLQGAVESTSPMAFTISLKPPASPRSRGSLDHFVLRFLHKEFDHLMNTFPIVSRAPLS
jgi:hypothetical protein